LRNNCYKKGYFHLISIKSEKKNYVDYIFIIQLLIVNIFIHTHARAHTRTHIYIFFDIQIEILTTGNGKCKARFTVNEDHLNALGSLHGGFTSTIIDCISSYALMIHEKNPPPGVSIDLHVT